MRKAFSVFLCVLLGIALAACSVGADTASDTSASASSSEPAAPEVTLNKQSITLTVGETFSLKATIKPGNPDAKVTWKSSDEKSVTVNGGLVTALAPGKFTVVATVEGSNRARCIVTVRETPEKTEDAEDTAQDGAAPQADAAQTDAAQADAGQGGAGQADTWQGQGQGGGGHTAPQGQAPAPAQPQAQPERQPVWIVTQPAWTEQVPIYENQYRRICNGCGADITDIGVQAHVDSVTEEMFLTGCGGWHSEYRDILVGYNEIHHPEQGYWQ